MKNVFVVLLLSFVFSLSAQTKKTSKKPVPKKKVSVAANLAEQNSHLISINDSIALLIPQKIEGKFGFMNQNSKNIIKPEYSNVGFFTEDCNLLNSPNPKVKKYGTKEYASVRMNDEDYRINTAGKRVYTFKKEDLGKCPSAFKAQLFHAYILNQSYGIIEDSKFENPADYRQFSIYPQFEYLHILEGDDLKNPMIVAAKEGKFGIIDVDNKIIIPFEYTDIKRNYSWKLARLFEVTKDGKNYYYIDSNNKGY